MFVCFYCVIRETSQDAATKPNRRGVKIEMKDGRGLTQRHELPEPVRYKAELVKVFSYSDTLLSPRDANGLRSDTNLET